MNHRVHHPPKPCKACGKPFHRRPNEKASAYTRRLTCGNPTCHAHASNRLRQQKPKPHKPHAPCIICHKPVHPHAHEKPHRYQARVTCSQACRIEAMRRTRIKLGLGGSRPRGGNSTDARRAKEAARKRAWRAERQKIAPEGYKWTGKFPTPDGMKAAWVSITGPALPPVQPKRHTGPKADLRHVLEAHPELAQAIAGTLTDSWFPYSRSSGLKGAPTDL